MTADPLAPWHVTSSRYVHRDEWIALRADDCQTRMGVEVAPYYVLEYPDWVQVIALDPDDNVVLVKQYRHGLGRVSTEVPAGRVDPDDLDPVAAAARELAEETGYVADMRLISEMSPNPATHANRIYVVLGVNARQLKSVALDPAEEIAVELVPYREAVRMALTGSIIHAPQVASLLLALAAAGKLGLG